MITNNAPIAMFSVLMIFITMTTARAENKMVALDEPILPIPVTSKLNIQKVLLGEKLFNDVRLSKNNTLSCASCHQLNNGGDDNLAIGNTADGKPHVINTPTIFNARYNFRQNWNGSAHNLTGQIETLVLNKLEANTDWETLLSKFKADREYKTLFGQIYSDGITKNNYLDAMVEFENSLVTPNARFDKFLRGDNDAISDEEKEGYMLFKNYGCVSCHQGINIGGNLFQKFGIFYNYFDMRGNIKPVDYGRQNITDRPRDKHVFKVPTLRNIALTAPYFHDGEVETLGSAISIMGKTQLGIILSKKDIRKIESFLNTLTGEYKGKPLSAEKS